MTLPVAKIKLSTALKRGAKLIKMDREVGSMTYLSRENFKDEGEVWCGCGVGCALVGYFGDPEKAYNYVTERHVKTFLGDVLLQLNPGKTRGEVNTVVDRIESLYEGWTFQDYHHKLTFLELAVKLKDSGF